MNLLFVGNDSAVTRRIDSISTAAGFKFYSVKNGFDALNRIHLYPIQVIIVSDKQQLMSVHDIIKKLNAQKSYFLVFTYVEKKSIPQLYSLLTAGNDRWLFHDSSDDELLNVLKYIYSKPLDFLKIERLRFQINRKFGINNLIGSSPQMTDLYRDLEITIGTDITVLIQGESGSGKELIARLLHLASPRKNNRFVGLNCAAIPRELMESELFGYEKGAFTGAANAKTGKFQIADRGTLFLDEIADMDIILQSKILRMLEQQEFERIGSNDTLRADVRILSASNKILENEIDEQRFRMDLFYRINSYTIHLPALRERKADLIPLLVHFVQKNNIRNKRKIEWIADEALNRLLEHPWSGNIRELENVLARSTLFSTGSIITNETINRTIQTSPKSVRTAPTAANPPPERPMPVVTIAEMEKQAILNALDESKGNMTRAAKNLGLSRVTIWRKIEKYELKNQIKEKS
ncbi:MAG: sigma-54-dependent Fis family transcriptional regulator [Candidatus Marinimicrobia bacterium]|nr:sigma-54-dependent Fis family transcriptional regulator [Candidatus Neomarinimicrobiota bacterium]